MSGIFDILHAFLLVLGVVATFSALYPQMLAAVGVLSIGLLTGLVVWEQGFGTSFGVDLHQDIWLPIVAAAIVVALAAVLVKYAWRLGLTILAAMTFSLLVLAILHFANVDPQVNPNIGGGLLSAYQLIGIIVFLVALVVAATLLYRYEWADFTILLCTSVHVGGLLLLSGLSHFSQRMGASEEPLVLVDELACLVIEFHTSICDNALQTGQCNIGCKLEITLWILPCWILIAILRLCGIKQQIFDWGKGKVMKRLRHEYAPVDHNESRARLKEDPKRVNRNKEKISVKDPAQADRKEKKVGLKEDSAQVHRNKDKVGILKDSGLLEEAKLMLIA